MLWNHTSLHHLDRSLVPKLSYLIIDNLNLLIEDWENNNFFGKIKIVLTYSPYKDVVCRYWIEQVARIKKRNLNGTISYKHKDKTNMACYDLKKKSWQFTNYNF